MKRANYVFIHMRYSKDINYSSSNNEDIVGVGGGGGYRVVLDTYLRNLGATPLFFSILCHETFNFFFSIFDELHPKKLPRLQIWLKFLRFFFSFQI